MQCLHDDGGDGGSDASDHASVETRAVGDHAAVPALPACTLSESDSGRGALRRGHCRGSVEDSMTAAWASQHHHSHPMHLSYCLLRQKTRNQYKITVISFCYLDKC